MSKLWSGRAYLERRSIFAGHHSIVSIMYLLNIIENGLELLFLWNKLRSRLHDKEIVAPETPPVENHCYRAHLCLYMYARVCMYIHSSIE